MFDLFLAALGLPAISFKFASESGKSNAAKKKMEADRLQTTSDRASWKKRVLDLDLEKSLRTEIQYNCEAFFEEYGDELTKSANKIWGNYALSHGTTEMSQIDALRILMANRGKLLKEDADFGIYVDEYKKTDLYLQEIQNKAKLVIWINEQLIKHGVREKLLARACSDYYIVRNEHICNDRFGGVYMWYPMVPVPERILIKEWEPHNWYR